MNNFADLLTVTRIDNFQSVQQDVLSFIEGVPTYAIKTPREQISKTDWTGHGQFMPPYLSLIQDAIEANMHAVTAKFQYASMSTIPDGIWFQQYHAGDYHLMHTHGACNFSSVMYIELPENSQTEFTLLGQTFKADVAEGDVVTFPSLMLHQSPPLAQGRKTIISFNSNVDGYSE